MVALPQAFKVSEAPQDEFEPIPAGTYEAMIIDSQMKDSKDRTGQYLELQQQIQGPTNKNRVITVRLNLVNKSDDAVRIAYSELAKICEAVGKESIRDSSELHNIRHQVLVEVEPAKPYMKEGVQQPGSPQNRIKKYFPLGASSSGSTTKEAGAAAASSPNGAPASPPWIKRG